MANMEFEDKDTVESTWYEHFLLSPDQKNSLRDTLLRVPRVKECMISPAAHIQGQMHALDPYIIKITIIFQASTRSHEHTVLRRCGEVIGQYFTISKINYRG